GPLLAKMATSRLPWELRLEIIYTTAAPLCTSPISLTTTTHCIAMRATGHFRMFPIRRRSVALGALGEMGRRFRGSGQRRMAGFNRGKRPCLSAGRWPGSSFTISRAQDTGHESWEWQVLRRSGTSRRGDRTARYLARIGGWRSLQRWKYGCGSRESGWQPRTPQKPRGAGPPLGQFRTCGDEE